MIVLLGWLWLSWLCSVLAIPQTRSGIVQGTLVNGTEDFPFIVNRLQKCGGVLIHRRWVLTAAHCSYQRLDEVVYHRFNLNVPAEVGGESSVVLEWIPNPRFALRGQTEADIALARIDPPATHTRPARLIKPSEVELITPGALFTVAGWGAARERQKGVNFLTETQVPIMAMSTCEGYVVQGLQPSNICAGFDEGGPDACTGDSGGPLFRMIDGIGVVIGVVSWGTGCGRPKSPGIYESVDYWRDWINGVVTQYGDTLSDTCKDHCGEQLGVGCGCDMSCTTRGDCCPDVEAVCQSKSCLDQCGQSTSTGCQCESSCVANNNCCEDYSLWCDEASPTASPTSPPTRRPPPPLSRPPTPPPSPAPRPKPLPPLSSPTPSPKIPLPSPTPSPKPSPKAKLKPPPGTTVVLPLRAQGGSCANHCDSFLFDEEGKRCWCDIACQFKGDCCQDRDLYCLGTSQPTASPTRRKATKAPSLASASPAPGSCVGKCGLQSGDCYCDSTCEINQDCCKDVTRECGPSVLSTRVPPPSQSVRPAETHLAVGPESSCLGRCGAFTGQCYCDSTCELTHDCCPDVVTQCGVSFLTVQSGPNRIEPYMLSYRADSEASFSASCANQCGSLLGLCNCDEACFLKKDCCFDMLQECGPPSWSKSPGG